MPEIIDKAVGKAVDKTLTKNAAARPNNTPADAVPSVSCSKALTTRRSHREAHSPARAARAATNERVSRWGYIVFSSSYRIVIVSIVAVVIVIVIIGDGILLLRGGGPRRGGAERELHNTTYECVCVKSTQNMVAAESWAIEKCDSWYGSFRGKGDDW
ncbi:hypothetical protein GGR51DRAFT_39461 [Nemania sp. FL0031]|nr:hypothetical protein GGR51DRAFT_39461 [Nemania sp. FL0031]